jgi:carbamoylphosphate synthase large subunit
MVLVAFVEANFSGVDAIIASADVGYTPILFTKNFEKLSQILPRGSGNHIQRSAQIIEVNTSSVEEMVRVLMPHRAELKAICTFSQPFTILTGMLAYKLGLPGASVNALELGRDKFKMREQLRYQGIENIRFGLALTPSEAFQVAKNVGYPLVIKPKEGQASLCVGICYNESELAAFFTRINKNKTNNLSVSAEFLIEEFMNGELYSVELMTSSYKNHLIWGISDRKIGPNGVEIAASFPVFPDKFSEICQCATTALDAIGFDFGPSHVEIIVTENGPKIVELNLRAGGSGITQLMDASTTQKFGLSYVEMCLGKKLTQPLITKGASWHSILAPKSGIIKKMPLANDIKSLGAHAYWEFKSVGEACIDDGSNFSWISQVMTVGENAHSASLHSAQIVKMAYESIEIETDSFLGEII